MTKQEFPAPTAELAIFSYSKATLEAIKNGETNVTSAINVLFEGLRRNGKSCILQWIPAHMNIEVNECEEPWQKKASALCNLEPTSRLQTQMHLQSLDFCTIL